MLISGKNLRLYYRIYTKSGSGLANIPEIEKEDYGYELLPGQKVYSIRYDGNLVNKEIYIHPTIVSIDENGIGIKDDLLNKNAKKLPWSKYGCNLYVEPCECLYEKNILENILKGNIKNETVRNGKIITEDGIGIWYKHGGWRTTSEYKDNLKNFIRLGQQSII